MKYRISVIVDADDEYMAVSEFFSGIHYEVITSENLEITPLKAGCALDLIERGDIR